MSKEVKIQDAASLLDVEAQDNGKGQDAKSQSSSITGIPAPFVCVSADHNSHLGERSIWTSRVTD